MGVIGEGVDLLKLVDKGAHADLYKQLGEWIDKVGDLQKEDDGLHAKERATGEQIVSSFKGSFQRIGSHTYVEGDEEEKFVLDARKLIFDQFISSSMNIDRQGRRATCPQCKTARATGSPVPRKRAQESAERRAAGSA